jgi:CheY-like chemotaxis protein
MGPHILISISDTGVGMNENIQNRVFEPFFTTKTKDKGTGLGLSTVFGIVKQNKGSIYTYSEPGKGTTFKIYWPSVKGDEYLVLDNNHQRVKTSRGYESLLVVEDDQDVREFTCTALRSLGYRVLEAQNGNNALKMVKEKEMRFDLLISDLVMPEMGGIEAAKKIKEIVPTIKVLLTSGYADNHVILNGEIEPDFNFIPKPYSQKMLGEKIRAILDSD